MREVDRINEIAEDLGIDGIQLEDPTDLDIEPTNGEAEAISVTLFKNHELGNHSSPIGDVNRKVLRDGVEWDITVKHRPQCPSCETVPSEENDRLHLAGRCRLCGNKVCNQCRVECNACGKVMCDDCSTGHGLKQETFCPDCREDVEEDIQFQRRLEEEKQEFNQEKQLMEHRRQVEKDEVKKKMQALRVLKDLYLQRQRREEDDTGDEWTDNSRFQEIEQAANRFKQ